MTPEVLTELTAGGVSLWLDDLDRSRLDTTEGERSLRHLIDRRAIRGVTTNPTIFDRAVGSGSARYVDQLRDLGRAGMDTDEAIRVVTTDDVRAACDVLFPVWEATGGLDGRVSIEVDPRLAHETDATIAQAQELWHTVDRPNAMIKIPATEAGLPAITRTLAQGISVNVTLIFSVDRYRDVIAAHLEGLQQAHAAGIDLEGIESVASFFVSRVDTAIDANLDTMTDPRAAELRGQAAIANARLAWAAYENHSATDGWRQLSASGARPQRPLWASTGVKDPSYDPTRYVVELAAPGCVNTVPEATLRAVAESGAYQGDTMSGRAESAAAIVAELSDVGIDMQAVCQQLEDAGVASFIDSWEQLRSTVASIMSN
jgi:transaldolase